MEKLYDHGFSGQAGYTEDKLIREAYDKLIKVKKINFEKLQEIEEARKSGGILENEELSHDEQFLSRIIIEKDFYPVYGRKKVDKDEQRAANREKADNEKCSPEEMEDKKRSEILEYIIFEQCIKGKWLGKDTDIAQATKYDDFFNHVDLIAEFKNPEESKKGFLHAGIAIDITFSKDLDEKIHRIKNEISEDKLGEVEYYKSKNTPPGKIKDVPRFLVALDRETTDELIELWLTGQEEKLNNHEVQVEIMSSLYLQCGIFKEKSHRKLEKVYEKYENILKIILDEKIEEIPTKKNKERKALTQLFTRMRAIL